MYLCKVRITCFYLGKSLSICQVPRRILMTVLVIFSGFCFITEYAFLYIIVVIRVSTVWLKTKSKAEIMFSFDQCSLPLMHCLEWTTQWKILETFVLCIESFRKTSCMLFVGVLCWFLVFFCHVYSCMLHFCIVVVVTEMIHCSMLKISFWSVFFFYHCLNRWRKSVEYTCQITEFVEACNALIYIS